MTVAYNRGILYRYETRSCPPIIVVPPWRAIIGHYRTHHFRWSCLRTFFINTLFETQFRNPSLFDQSKFDARFYYWFENFLIFFLSISFIWPLLMQPTLANPLACRCWCFWRLGKEKDLSFTPLPLSRQSAPRKYRHLGICSVCQDTPRIERSSLSSFDENWIS